MGGEYISSASDPIDERLRDAAIQAKLAGQLQQLHVGHVYSHLGQHTAYVATRAEPRFGDVEVMREAFGAIRRASNCWSRLPMPALGLV